MRSGENWTKETERQAERTLGYTFRNKKLLLSAFTHKSYGIANDCEHNERLEFLGDSVLQLCVTERLFLRFDVDEGTLTERRQEYVSKEALSGAAERAGIMQYLRYLGGEHNVSGKTASNLFEAVLAAMYLDGGMEPVRAFLKKNLVRFTTGNYKTELQELVQGLTEQLPEYRVTGEKNAFECEVTALGISASGTGESKKAAEQRAAQALLKILYEERK